jgi:signal transduction histidine kinase
MRATFLLQRRAAPSADDARSQAGESPSSAGPAFLARHPYLVLTAAVLIISAFCALIQGALWSQAPTLAAMNLATSATFVATGLLLRRERGQNGMAWALILTGICRSVDFADTSLTGPMPFYGIVFGGIDRLFGGWALLRYPNPRLLRHQRLFLIILATWMVAGRTLLTMTSRPQWFGYAPASWWPTLVPDVHLNDIINVVVNAGQGALGVVALVLLTMRLFRTRGLDRVVIAPIIMAGLAATVAAGASALAQMMISTSATPIGAYLTESVVDLAVPLAFLVAVMQRTLLLRGITGLVARLSSGADVDSVRHALRTALHDPTLDVLDLSADGPLPGLGAGPGPDPPGPPAPQADREAGPTAAARPLAAGPGDQPEERLVEFIHAESGAPIAVVLADPSLARYQGLFDAAVQTSGLALKNAELQARAARAELEQVRASRARIVEAALAERRRLERDLHDGAQQHILGLAAQLTAAMTRTGDPGALAAFGRARDQLKAVLAELRDLAHGIHPAVLSQEGLAAALEGVAERLPLPIRVTAPTARAAPAIEATAYFVACEALSNIIKHAQASAVTVEVEMDGSALRMQITDDGVGGATASGHGLANIADRVGALGGDVSIDSPPGRGTRLSVRIPCG